MTSVDDVIQPGQPIPDDVTEVKDGAKSPWRLTSKGHWHLRTAQITCLNDDCGGDGYALMRQVGQRLTVTAVREQPAEPARKLIGPSYAHLDAPCTDACYEPVTEPQPVQPCGICGDFGCPACDDSAPRPGPEPQQADASPLLDLVRQYGDAIGGAVSAGECGGPDDVWGFEQEAAELLARIAALVPQQPVQARGRRGSLWWIHPCGTAMSSPDTPGSVHNRIPPCDKPGPWLPLLVGGDPAPEGATLAWVRRALRERNEARAEVERLQSDNDRLKRLHAADEKSVLQVIEERDDAQDWADRLTNAVAEHLGVDIGEHSNMNLPWQAALLALEFTASPQPDPLVLSLPEVPEGTEALVGVRGGRRYEPFGDLPACEEPAWRRADDGALYPGIGGVLDAESPDGVRVELAPPCEPRTWSKLDPVPDDLRHVRGASGTVYDRTPGTFAFSGYRNGESVTRNLHILREEDGPLDEVLK